MFLTFEVAVLVNHEARDEAIELLAQWLADHPADQEALLTHAALCIENGNLAPAQLLSRSLPEPESIAPVSIPGYATIVFEASGLSDKQQARLAYRLWRRHRDLLPAWKAFLFAAFGKAQSAPPQTIEAISEYTAAQVQIDGVTEPRWFVVVPPGAQVSRDMEASADSPIGKALVGKRIGETVHLPDAMGVRDAVVLAVAPAETFVARWCLDNSESTFPGCLPIRRVELPRLEDARSHAEHVEAFRPMTKLLQQQAVKCQQAEEAFANRRITLFQLANAIGKGELETIDTVLHHSKHRLIAGVEGRKVAFARGVREGASLEIVLSPSALLVLARSGLLENVLKTLSVYCPRLLCEAVDEVVDQLVDPRWGQWVHAEGDMPAIATTTDQSRREQTEWWQWIQRVVSKVKQESGLALLEMPSVKVAQMLQVVGPVSTRAGAIAKSKNISMLCDDGIAAAIAENEFGIGTLSTNDLVELMLSTGQMQRVDASASRARLICLNLIGVNFNDEVVVAGLREACWDSTRSPARHCIDTIATLSWPSDQVVQLAARVLARMWREVPTMGQQSQIVLSVLDALNKRGNFSIRTFEVQLERAFGIDPIGAEQAKASLAAWWVARKGRPS